MDSDPDGEHLSPVAAAVFAVVSVAVSLYVPYVAPAVAVVLVGYGVRDLGSSRSDARWVGPSLLVVGVVLFAFGVVFYLGLPRSAHFEQVRGSFGAGS